MFGKDSEMTEEVVEKLITAPTAPRDPDPKSGQLPS